MHPGNPWFIIWSGSLPSPSAYILKNTIPETVWELGYSDFHGANEKII